jgi:hypothetical protein
MNPAAVPGQDTIALDPLPRLSTHGFYWGAPDLLSVTPQAGTNDVNYGALSYLNPFPSAWEVFGYLGSVASTTVSLPGAATPMTANGTMLYEDTAANFVPNVSSGTFAPQITPPQNPTIQGVSAFSDQSGVTTTPTVAWSAPAVGTPTGYRVRFMRLNNNGGAVQNIQNTTFFVPPSITSVTVPSGMLLAGSWYQVTITAYIQPSLDATTAPNKFTAYRAAADAVLNKFLP